MTNSEQGITRPGYEANSADTAYTVQGFNLIGTGGNCTAFYKPLPNGKHILITIPHEPIAPQDAAEPVTVGLHCDEHSEALDQFDAPDSDAVAFQLAHRYAHWGMK